MKKTNPNQSYTRHRYAYKMYKSGIVNDRIKAAQMFGINYTTLIIPINVELIPERKGFNFVKIKLKAIE